MFNNGGDNFEEDRRLEERKRTEHRREYTDSIKQYVRMHGWVPAARERLNKIRETGRTYLKYFTLCAGLAIDVWWFYLYEDLIDYDERGFPDVVFCERVPEEYEEIGRGLKRTRGYLASFEELILKRETENSIDFFSQLPFDVYNLDFSGVCFPKKEPPFSSTLESITTLIRVLGEPEYRQQGFDMFFTFRAQESEENRDAINDLRTNLRENRKYFSEFNTLITQKYGANLENLNHYHDLLLITLPKYLGKLGMDIGFRVRMTHRYYYPRPTLEHPEFYIISFGLSFDWVERATELRRGLHQPVLRDEITIDAYHEMMIQLVRDDISNVEAIRFAREDYRVQVQQLLETVEAGGDT
jgi:hypothetical protein